ncbi:MAG: hypothetical protein A3J67_05220 [Parcubacteria group bacterium RIFCSPHIGHO2_02_FULL_48_10b]|nr:MAG: hypothetical protein A3J67_05220 [Parcubacteria group bacterium RIFCSPHIGHO2_02_FULL_48_10b]
MPPAPQEIPGGFEITDPPPAFATEMVYNALNVAVTARFPLTLIVQVLPDGAGQFVQPVKLALGEAVKTTFVP